MSSRYTRAVALGIACGFGIIIGSFFTSIIMGHETTDSVQAFDQVSQISFDGPGLGIYEDNETGCQYVVVANRGGMVPRLRANGEIWCGENEGSL